MNRIPIVSLVHYTKKELKEALGEKGVDFLNWEDYCWIKQKGDRPIQDPEWPDNFINTIRSLVYEVEGLEEYKDLKYIFLNAGGEILKKIVANKIPVVIVMPKKFEGKYTPVEHYQDLNKKYLELDMPMIYLEDRDFLNAFSRESTYDYLKNKTEFVEGFRFGTCDFIEDLDEANAIYEYLKTQESCNEILKTNMDITGPFAITSGDGNTISVMSGFMDALNDASSLIATTDKEEFIIVDSGNKETPICKVVKSETGEIMIRRLDL